MATNLGLDDKLIADAVDLGGHQSKKDAVNAALREYVQRRKQMKIVELFGTIEFDRRYNYKVERGKKR